MLILNILENTISLMDIDILELVNQLFGQEAPPQAPAPEPGAAQEAPPQAPEPAEVPHPDPHEILKDQLHCVIRDQVRSHCERRPWKRGLSVHFPSMREIYSNVANDIMSSDLEVSAMDTETLRGWVEEVQEKDRKSVV